jgi:hypothetical protein
VRGFLILVRISKKASQVSWSIHSGSKKVISPFFCILSFVNICFIVFVCTDIGNDFVTDSVTIFSGSGNDCAKIGNDSLNPFVTDLGNDSLLFSVMIFVTDLGNPSVRRTLSYTPRLAV